MSLPSFKPRPTAAGLVALAALGIHALFLLALPAELQRNESADFTGFYRPLAERLLDGRGLSGEDGQVATRYPPGFPAVIAVTLGVGRGLGLAEQTSLALMNALCVALAAGLLTRLGHLLTGDLRAGVLAGLLWSVYPPFLWLAKQPNSEMPFLVLLLAGLLVWMHALEPGASQDDGLEQAGSGGAGSSSVQRPAATALIAGLLLGLATLVRPFALLLAPVLALAALAWRLPVRRWALLATAIVAGQVLALAPWELWVHHRTDRFIPVSSGGRLSLLDGLTLGAQEGERAPALPPRVLALTADIEAHRREIRGVRDAAAFLADRAGEDPQAVAGLLLIKAARSFYGTESIRYETPLLILQVPFLAVALAGLLALRRPGRWLIVAFVLYSWGMTVLVLSILRYMVPAMALLTLPVASLLLRYAPDHVRNLRPFQP